MKTALTVFVVFLLFCLSLYMVINFFTISDDCTVLRTIETEDGTIEVVNPTCKEGLPHTSGPNTIRMTAAALSEPRAPSTLVHERVHLDQKRSSKAWYDFYKHTWGYTLLKTPPPGLPYKYQYDLRPNPDTADAPWAVWQERYVFFPNYGPKRTLKDAEVKVWDLQDKQIVDVPPAWRSAFCSGNGKCPHQYEHPHEIAAEYITEKLVTPASAKLFAWVK